ncbi:MAG TPA: PqiC family protein [Steroidobacteraceae bacterium]|jgi:uncharacterized lipoprotein YmbA|nr:PqiC family protein [Steroidobacteraceae bacterium]
MSKLQTGWRVIGCSAAMMLGACHSAPTRIHTLDPVVPATRLETYQAPPLRVDTVNVPASWDRLEILEPAAAGTLEIGDLDHWSAPLAQIVRQTLSDDLDRRLPPGTVIYPRLPKPDGALGIDVDILEFTVAGSQASMRASWLIVPGVGSQSASARRSTASPHATLTSTGPAAVARAWSELIGQLADRIAADAASLKAP